MRTRLMDWKLRTLFSIPLLTLSCLVLPGALRADSIQDSINATDTPVATGTWTASDVGWLYTPSTSYELTEILTEFASGSQAVTEAIYSGLPDAGGVLLTLSPFGTLPGAFSGGLFPAISLTAGDTYFIAFEGVAGLGVNYTEDPGAESLGTLYSDFGGDSFDQAESGAITTQPILEFVGQAAVATPEPSSLFLLGVGLLGLGILASKRTNAPQSAAL